ncbi:putative DNA-binding domain-containing protein [Legionella lytica]|uniref:DNA-binding domain-containing protein n=1 Tax=Legionella lytica TaxID=96232 RepID=A0ABY4YBT4_9GAMM|nr:putative DNA-binding domain-containing protein [Legionella lytica]USQ14675.1 putative DNA-binding domain-containing protein [Legionella lytica]
MNELKQLQEQFHQFLLSGDNQIHRSIIRTKQVSVETRLSIYRDAYELRLIESLAANFPCLYAYLGTEEFNHLGRAYLKEYPSSFRSIRWFGDNLATFIHTNYSQYAYLSELADFEWKMTLAFDAPEASLVSVADMAAVPPDAWANLQFVLHPAVQRLNYLWNSVSLWQALAHEHDLPEIQQQTETSAWILWRTPELMIQFCSLSPEEAWALDRLAQGASFGALCEGFCQWIAEEEVGMHAASYLKNWIQRGFFSNLLINSSS